MSRHRREEQKKRRANEVPPAARPAAPFIRQVKSELVPDYLIQHSTQWCGWHFGSRGKGSDLTKIPLKVKHGDRWPWWKASEPCGGTSFWDILAIHVLLGASGFLGVGFTPGPEDDLGFVDLDNVLTGEAADPTKPLTLGTPGIAPHALDILRRLNSYAERTPSCRGLRVWFRMKDKPLKGLKVEVPFKLEVYFAFHYSTVTGDHVEGTAFDVLDCTDAVRQLLADFIPKAKRSRTEELAEREAQEKAARAAREERERRRLERATATTTTNASQGEWAGRGDLPEDEYDRVVERARRYVAKIHGAVSGQGGHNRTFHVACVLVRDFMLDRHDARDIISEWNATCVPPWTAKELEHKLDGAEAASGPMGKKLDGWGDAGTVTLARKEGKAVAAPLPPKPPTTPEQVAERERLAEALRKKLEWVAEKRRRKAREAQQEILARLAAARAERAERNRRSAELAGEVRGRPWTRTTPRPPAPTAPPWARPSSVPRRSRESSRRRTRRWRPCVTAAAPRTAAAPTSGPSC
jgi:hypothetical protein